jgi:hypothetical protein
MLRALLPTAFAVGAIAGRAHASPRSDPTSGRAVFTGATMLNDASIDLNPAAIGPGPAPEVLFYMTAMAVIDHYTITRDHLDIATGAITPGAAIHDNEVGPGGTSLRLPFQRRGRSGPSKSPPAEVFISDRDTPVTSSAAAQRTYSLGIAQLQGVERLLLALPTLATTLHLHYARDTGSIGAAAARTASTAIVAARGVENPTASGTTTSTCAARAFSTSNQPST